MLRPAVYHHFQSVIQLAGSRDQVVKTVAGDNLWQKLEVPSTDSAFMLRPGYILGRNVDWVWFIALPYVALAAALACQKWLSATATASVALWVTIPHHFSTWVRAYGIAEDRRRWKARLILGPIVIFFAALAGIRWAPISVLLLAILWDKQHSLMQQHGFARIYDFKAKTGAPSTARFDLILNWILFFN